MGSSRGKPVSKAHRIQGVASRSGSRGCGARTGPPALPSTLAFCRQSARGSWLSAVRCARRRRTLPSCLTALLSGLSAATSSDEAAVSRSSAAAAVATATASTPASCLRPLHTPAQAPPVGACCDKYRSGPLRSPSSRGGVKVRPQANKLPPQPWSVLAGVLLKMGIHAGARET